MTLLLLKKGGMIYTAGLIVLHLQLLFVVVVVLTNYNKPRWLTCDSAWHACGEYITPALYFKNKPFEIKEKYYAVGYWEKWKV